MMLVRSVFEWLGNQPSSIAIRESIYGFPVLLTVHAVSMAVFAGLIVMMDLRLVGLAYRRTPLSQVQRNLFPWQMFGLALSSVTGMVLFYQNPMRYYGKVFFWMKMALMVAAGINALIFHMTTYKSVARWDNDVATPFGARVAGAVSLAAWASVVAAGRLAAYNWLTYE